MPACSNACRAARKLHSQLLSDEGVPLSEIDEDIHPSFNHKSKNGISPTLPSYVRSETLQQCAIVAGHVHETWQSMHSRWLNKTVGSHPVIAQCMIDAICGSSFVEVPPPPTPTHTHAHARTHYPPMPLPCLQCDPCL